MSSRPDNGTRTDIAIVGMSGRFPGARTLEEFWQNLRDGVESRTEFSDEDLLNEGIAVSTHHPRHVRAGFVLEDCDKFDAGFFGINPREAETLEPQHRVFLECAWEALENAGYDAERFGGRIGIFAGATYCNYLILNLFRSAKAVRHTGHRQLVFGSVPDYMVTRVAYRLNLTGPAYFVQTACSTSLSAVHLAAQSLTRHECDMVLAGGVSVKVPQRLGYLYEEGGMESPDGRVRTFDANAKGTVFGSGVGAVVLKRLTDALADRDHIHAVIRGTATNNDGSTKVGFTAPGVVGQAEVVAQALENSGVSADAIDYIETHGTGTELGDPIEIAALTRAFATHTSRRGYCAIGSVKPNVGHLDAAAGVSSLIKTVLALQHRQIPPTINFERLNPKIELERSPFFINTTLRDWASAEGRPRRAGVSSFGFGGTNAHVVVEEAPPEPAASASRQHQLLVLSARTPAALDAASLRLADYLARDGRTNLADVAFTLQMGRRPFAHRRAIVCDGRTRAIEALHGDAIRWTSNDRASAKDRPVVFMFPGQGAQYVNMGRALYDEEPVFREVVAECAESLRPHLGFDIRDVLYPGADAAADATRRLTQTSVTQAAIFTIELALARTWIDWGVTPTAMIGHSIGEYVAAAVSGVLTVADALRLVALRGQLMESMPAGAMLAVPLPASQLASMFGADLWLAAANSPSLSVASGGEDAIRTLERRLADQGIEGRRLHTSHAFHSGLMDGAVAAFVDAARSVTFHSPSIPYVSNVTGGWVTADLVADPNYWGTHIRQTVRFADGVSRLLEDDDRAFLEVGPGNTLSTFVRHQSQRPDSRVIVSSMRHPNEDVADGAVALNALGRLWVSGAAVDWKRFSSGEERHRVPLPTYPFERARHWVMPDKPDLKAVRRSSGFLQPDPKNWFYVPAWTSTPAVRADAGAPESWVVFEDESGVGRELTGRLQSAGSRVVTVRAAAAFREAGDGAFEINPTSRADYVTLVRRLRQQLPRPSAIAHCWMVGEAPPDAPDQYWDERGFFSLLYLAQALGEAGASSSLTIQVLTTGLHDVSGDEELTPRKATVLGPARVIPLEFGHIACRVIDFSLADARPQLIDRLTDELLGRTDDIAVAYRRGRRWALSYEQHRLEDPKGPPSRVRDAGTYLITGGLGGIGLVLAGWLAKTARCNLVLTSRRGLPPRDQWDAVLARSNGSDQTVGQILQVRQLEADGAQVLVASADTADRERMREVLAEATARFGAIHGVIHSAGVAGGGMIQLKKPEAAVSVMRPKVDGTIVLGGLLDGQPLDFFLLCSSLTSVLGGVGQVDYCGANAFLDAYARWHSARTGTFTVAVNWSAWREIGMAVDTDIHESLRGQFRDRMLAAGLGNRDGIEATRRILDAAPASQVAVSQVDVYALLHAVRDSVSDEADTDAAADTRTGAQSGTSRPELASTFAAPRTETERKLCSLWQESLGIAQIGVNDSFFDLGGHSLLAVRMMTRINETLGTEIPVAKLYEGLTVAFLAQLIDGKKDAAVSEAADFEARDRRREKARRQKEHQQRRLAMARR